MPSKKKPTKGDLRAPTKAASSSRTEFDPGLSYARQKLASAVRILATHRGNVKERLRVAVIEFIAVKEDDFPGEIRKDFAWIKKKLTSKAPMWKGQGTINATLYRMHLSTAQVIAEKIVALESELESHYSEMMKISK